MIRVVANFGRVYCNCAMSTATFLVFVIGVYVYDLSNHGCKVFDMVGILNGGRSMFIESCALMLRFCAAALFAVYCNVIGVHALAC